jgi:DNA-binding MarR family transcriptional regulator
MIDRRHTEAINDLLGSVQIAATAIGELMVEQLQEATEDRLTVQQLKLLKLIANTKSYSLSDVASFLGISKAAASKSVDRLVRRDLIRRDEAEGDRRAIALSLTDQGVALLQAYEKVSVHTLEHVFGRYSPRQLRDLSKLLDELSLRIMEHNREEGEVCLRCGIYFKDRCLLKQLSGRPCYYDEHKATRPNEPAFERVHAGNVPD